MAVAALFAAAALAVSCTKEEEPEQEPEQQPFVSKTPSNKNVILEEYTGVNCGYCPDGHRIANEIVAANPGRAWAINIHTGQYAVRYSTEWGEALAGQTGLTGYPSGTVNRHVFSGSSTALNRGKWTAAAAEIMAQPAPVNVAARCTIDRSTRVMTVEVEAYYTSNSSASYNYLNVAVLQNNILGPQSGGSNYNPSQMEGSQYRHMHMLRHLLSGQWGDMITKTSEGNLFSKKYTYTIPETISDEAMVLSDLEVVAFITESHQEILNGCKATVVLK